MAATWPDATEFTKFLTGAGVVDVMSATQFEALDLNGALGAGVEKWNEATRYWPFLSDGQTGEERRFDPNIGGLIDFNSGLILCQSVRTEVTFSNPAGITRVQDRDYTLQPMDAPPKHKPWTYLTPGFYGVWGFASGWPQSIRVTGEWGYCNGSSDFPLPDAARRGVMEYAASELMAQITLALRRGGLDRFSQGDETKAWAQKINEMRDFWEDVARRTVEPYKRKRVA